jgi:hypothetical protein
MNNAIIEKILNSNGKIFTVDFIKQDGTLRTLNGRLGVKKYLKGGKCTLDQDQYIILFDMQKKVYRAVNKFTIQSVKGL